MPGHDRGRVEDVGLGDDEDLAELLVELAGDVAGHLEVLLLVLAHRDEVGQVDEDVRRLQHRVGEQAVVGRDPLGDLVLVADGPLQQSHGRDAGEDPGELGDLGDVLLGKKGALLGVEPEREKVQSHSHRVLPQKRGVLYRRQRVVAGDEVEGIVPLLQRDVLAECPEVVAQMGSARGLYAGEYSHFGSRVFWSFVMRLGRATPAAWRSLV